MILIGMVVILMEIHLIAAEEQKIIGGEVIFIMELLDIKQNRIPYLLMS